ncbi:MAG: DUF2237 domain-containing protein [Pseudomonadota bacterium]
MNWPQNQLNVFDEPLQSCSEDPITGFMRNGCCETGPGDVGSHTICVKITDEFLHFSKSKGNNLIDPIPEFGFPGLKAGDQWCVCAARWKEAFEAGVAPRVFLQSTHKGALETVDLRDLSNLALDLS